MLYSNKNRKIRFEKTSWVRKTRKKSIKLKNPVLGDWPDRPDVEFVGLNIILLLNIKGGIEHKTLYTKTLNVHKLRATDLNKKE